MRNEPRFVNARKLTGDPVNAHDIARALDDPFTVIEDKKSGDVFIVYDNERVEGGDE